MNQKIGGKMKHDIEWMIETLERSKTMLVKLRDDSESHAMSASFRSTICQIDAAKLMAKGILRDQENESTK